MHRQPTSFHRSCSSPTPLSPAAARSEHESLAVLPSAPPPVDGARVGGRRRSDLPRRRRAAEGRAGHPRAGPVGAALQQRRSRHPLHAGRQLPVQPDVAARPPPPPPPPHRSDSAPPITARGARPTAGCTGSCRPAGEDVDCGAVVERHQRGLREEARSTSQPQRRRRGRSERLGLRRARHQGVDRRIAELRRIRVPIGCRGDEGVAAELRRNEVGRRWIAREPAPEPGLYPLARVEDRMKSCCSRPLRAALGSRATRAATRGSARAGRPEPERTPSPLPLRCQSSVRVVERRRAATFHLSRTDTPARSREDWGEGSGTSVPRRGRASSPKLSRSRAMLTARRTRTSSNGETRVLRNRALVPSAALIRSRLGARTARSSSCAFSKSLPIARSRRSFRAHGSSRSDVSSPDCHDHTISSGKPSGCASRDHSRKPGFLTSRKRSRSFERNAIRYGPVAGSSAHSDVAIRRGGGDREGERERELREEVRIRSGETKGHGSCGAIGDDAPIEVALDPARTGPRRRCPSSSPSPRLRSDVKSRSIARLKSSG